MIMGESAENYLETILILSKRKAAVRSVDIATQLGFSKPSVSRAVGILKEGGYIHVDKEGFITLLPAGREVAHYCLRLWAPVGSEASPWSQSASREGWVVLIGQIQSHISLEAWVERVLPEAVRWVGLRLCWCRSGQ